MFRAVLIPVILGLSVLAAASSAQDAGQGTLYLNPTVITEADAGTRVLTLTQDAPSTTAQKAYMATGLGALTYSTQFNYKFTEAAVLSGNLVAKVWVSCDVATAYRPSSNNGVNNVPTTRFILFKGTTEIGRFDRFEASPPTCTGSSSVAEWTYTVDTKGTEFAANDVLGAQFVMWNANPPSSTQGKNAHFVISSTRPSSIKAVGLPGGALAAPTSKLIQEDLEGQTAEIQHSFANATSDTYLYNWTTELGTLVLRYNSTSSNGTANVTVHDDSGTEVLNITLEGTASGNETIQDAQAGAWEIRIAYASYSGALSLFLEPPPAPTTASTGGTNTTSTSATANMTAKANEGGGGIPAPGLIGAALGTLVAAAWSARRRR